MARKIFHPPTLRPHPKRFIQWPDGITEEQLRRIPIESLRRKIGLSQYGRARRSQTNRSRVLDGTKGVRQYDGARAKQCQYGKRRAGAPYFHPEGNSQKKPEIYLTYCRGVQITDTRPARLDATSTVCW